MSVLSGELFQEGLEVQPLRDLSLSGHQSQDQVQVEVMHEGMEVDEVFVASTLTGEQGVSL